MAGGVLLVHSTGGSKGPPRSHPRFDAREDERDTPSVSLGPELKSTDMSRGGGKVGVFLRVDPASGGCLEGRHGGRERRWWWY